MDQQAPLAQVTNDPFASVRIPEFKNLMIGRFTFIMSLRMMTTLLGWWVYNLTDNPLMIGLLGLSEVIPAISMALYAGHVIDSSDKRKLVLKGVIAYFVAAVLILFLTSHYSTGNFSKTAILVSIYTVIFGTGIARSFSGPTFSAMIATIVPRQLLQNATTWTQSTWLFASVSGHAVGGFLIYFLGITGTMITVCCVLIISFIALNQLKPKPPLARGEKKTWESVKEGVRFVFRTKEILAAFSLDMFAVLFGGAKSMVPVYARDILHVGPLGYGWLNAAIDIGAIIIVIFLTISPLRKAQGRKLLFAVAGFGCCIIIFALSKSFLLSFSALLVAGMLDGISVVVRGTVIQLRTPDPMRGRVSSVSSMFINSSNELGDFESGVMARLMGNVPSVAFGGCMTLLVVLVTWLKAPTLRKFQY